MKSNSDYSDSVYTKGTNNKLDTMVHQPPVRSFIEHEFLPTKKKMSPLRGSSMNSQLSPTNNANEQPADLLKGVITPSTLTLSQKPPTNAQVYK